MFNFIKEVKFKKKKYKFLNGLPINRNRIAFRKINFTFLSLYNLPIIFGFAIIITGTFFTMIVKGDSHNFLSKSIFSDFSFIQMQRGIFYDNANNKLVENIPTYSIAINPIHLNEEGNLDDLAAKLAIILDNSNGFIENTKKLIELNQKGSIATNITFEQAARIKNELANYKSTIILESTFSRNYFFPYEYSHILGYVRETDNQSINNESDFLPGEKNGAYKLEESLNTELKGIKGVEIYIDGVSKSIPGIPGNNVFLNIDTNWQKILYKIVANETEANGATGGSGAIINISNGKVLALVSYPGFDINQFANQLDSAYYDSLLNDYRLPLIDKAIGTGAPPGSSFKILSAFNLLEQNVVNRDTYYYSNRCIDLGNYEFCEFGKFFYGYMDLPRALYKSSNLFFCDSYRNTSFDVVNSLITNAELFNIGAKTGIDLPGETPGILDSPEHKEKTLNESWFVGDTCNLVIGQGALLVTPIQLATAVAALENGGNVFKPQVINSAKDLFGNTVKSFTPEIIRNISIKSETLELINKGMLGNVYNPEGIVYRFLHDIPGNIKAKTGTAEVIDFSSGEGVSKTHGWIVGTFDFAGETYAFTFHLKMGTSGSDTAVIARKFINCVNTNIAPGCENI